MKEFPLDLDKKIKDLKREFLQFHDESEGSSLAFIFNGNVIPDELTLREVGFLRGFPEFDKPIDFELLVKKPYGIFGKTGLGKSILNKLLCLNILKHDVSQILLFDMQGEYGLTSRADNTKGLKFYYPDKVKIYRLGELEGKKKTIDDAEPFVIYKENIDSGDIIASSQTLREPTINVLLKFFLLKRN